MASIVVGTNFVLLLRNAGITTVVILGIATEIGVESTARDAINRGFFPVVITDAVSIYNQEAHLRSLENMKSMMIILTTEELALEVIDVFFVINLNKKKRLPAGSLSLYVCAIGISFAAALT